MRLLLMLLVSAMLTACGGGSVDRSSPWADPIAVLGAGFPIKIKEKEVRVALTIRIRPDLESTRVSVDFPNPADFKNREVQTVEVTGNSGEVTFRSAPIKGFKSGQEYYIGILATDSSTGETVYRNNQPIVFSLPPGVTIN